MLPIPVSRDGLHDLDWLRQRAPRAGMVCTMAANNETGVVSDLDGIAQALAGSPALWMVDSVQALGKLPLDLARRPIDYAPFSGHKLYAPKGIGLLYVRQGAPITPLMAGGGQEGALRSGTENVSGIAALGAVLEALGDGATFHDEATLKVYRNRIAAALVEAFPALQFNAPQDLCLPTTLNFSVPGLNSRLLLDLFDAAGVRVSGGSACSAGKAGSSYVLEAMGLPNWRAASAIRLSFGPATERALIDEACERIRACSAALRLHCVSTGWNEAGEPLDGITRFAVNGRCCYLVADAASRSCIVIDPQLGLADRLAQLLGCHGYLLHAVLQTQDLGDQAAQALCSVLPSGLGLRVPHETSGWPVDTDEIPLGHCRVTRLAVQDGPASSWAYVLHDPRDGVNKAFVGAAVNPGRPVSLAADLHGRHDSPTLLNRLEQCVGRHGLLLPGFDPGDAFATTVAVQGDVRTGLTPGGSPQADGPVELGGAALRQLLKSSPGVVLVDVREPYEQHLSAPPDLGRPVRSQAVALSSVINALPGWLDQAATTPLLFFLPQRWPQLASGAGLAAPGASPGLEPGRGPGTVAVAVADCRPQAAGSGFGSRRSYSFLTTP